jgi:uncharacterized protein with HEPN domain
MKQIDVEMRVNKLLREIDPLNAYQEMIDLRNRLNSKLLKFDEEIVLSFCEDNLTEKEYEMVYERIKEKHNWNNPLINSRIHKPRN